MTDLREKISDILDEWVKSVLDYSNYEGDIPNTICDIADRILALLPKMPELRWLGDQLFLGSLRVGLVEDRNGQMLLCAGEKTIGGAMPMNVARAAVDAAVRKALGWVEA